MVWGVGGVHPGMVGQDFLTILGAMVPRGLPFRSLKISTNKGYPMGVRNKKYLQYYILVLFYFSFI